MNNVSISLLLEEPRSTYKPFLSFLLSLNLYLACENEREVNVEEGGRYDKRPGKGEKHFPGDFILLMCCGLTVKCYHHPNDDHETTVKVDVEEKERKTDLVMQCQWIVGMYLELLFVGH